MTAKDALRSDAEYTVVRARAGGYVVQDPCGNRIGHPETMWGARRIIRQHKRGKGVGTTVYRESA